MKQKTHKNVNFQLAASPQMTAADPPNDGLSATVPPPPAHYKYFTDDNLQRLKELKEENPETALPFPLSVLVPPEPPQPAPETADTDAPPTTYRSFGNVWQIDNALLSLKDLNIQQLYKDDSSPDSPEHAKARVVELKKLSSTLLIKFLELTGVMSINPELFPAKVDDIRVILINLHHLLNEYRPHQSRESLLMLIEDQIAQKRAEITSLRDSNAKIRDQIASLSTRFQQLTEEHREAEAEAQADAPPQQANGASSNPKATLSLSAKSLDQLSWSLLDYNQQQK